MIERKNRQTSIVLYSISGECEWELFKPMVELSRDFTLDLQEDQLGEPMQVVTLKPGDMLYFPRGVIYLAKTTEKGNTFIGRIDVYIQGSLLLEFQIHELWGFFLAATFKEIWHL